MTTTQWIIAAAVLLLSTAHAGTRITSEDGDSRNEQYFDAGNFVVVDNGRPTFGVDVAGNCWFIDSEQLVSDSCARMLDSVGGMREQAMAGLGAQERAMVEQMMGMQRGAAANIRALGERQIAGYSAACHAIGDSREICVSARLLDELKAEMGNSRFTQMMQRFQQSSNQMGGKDPQAKALASLLSSGYPMSDMQRASAMPGMNQAMLQYLPEAQRAQIMQQMAAAGGGNQLRGSRVVSVEHGVAMPEIDLSRYRRVTFEEYMRRMMGSMPVMPRGR